MNIVAQKVEQLTTELNQYNALTTYQVQQIMIRYIPVELHELIKIRAISEGKTEIDLIFS